MSIKSSRRFRAAQITLVGIAVIAATGCGAPKDPADRLAPARSCEKSDLDLVAEGTFTIGTDKPAYPPWFVDDEPSNGKGYESAVGYAIARELGFAKNEVTWAVVPFNSVIAPGAKDFDIDLNQVSINDERRQAVDFSSGYYDVRQTVITYPGSPIEGATSLADLKDAKLGAQVGTTSYTQASDQIAPTDKLAVFDTNDLAVQALKNKQIAGLVVDLPTAFYMTSTQLEGGVIVGQLPATGADVEQFGAVLAKDSTLTQCVSEAVDSLRSDGTLAKLESKWLQTEDAPELS